MNRHGRILIVDDEGQWREELVETLQHGGFYADSASSTDQALEQLDKSIYHVMILDIRMIHAEQSNIDGIKLLRELDRNGQNEATKVIILSAFGTQEQMRMAFTKYKVADFLSKNDFNNQEFLENVRLVFSEKVNINLALQIHWQRGSGSEIVLNLLVDGNRVKPGSSLQMQMVAELEDLLCRLFYHSESILVRPLIAGQSGMGVLRIKPFFPTGGGHEVIVKFGEIKRLEEEFRNFKEYVQPFLGGMRNTTVLDLRRTMHLGGIMYSLLGTTNDQLVDFGDFYRHSDLQKVKNAINQLFRDTCGVWFANHAPLRPLDLRADYQRLFDYTPERLEQVISDQMKSVQGKQKLSFQNLKDQRSFVNPLLMLAGQFFVRSTYLSITHGDFNQHNILVDSSGHVWLIDFQGTGLGHILRDVAMLDSVVRFQLLATDEATLDERLQMEQVLCGIERFSQVEQLATNFHTENQALAKAYATAVYLRSIAHRLVHENLDDDLSEYYVALLYNALNTVRFTTLATVQREHALLSASLLVERLGLTA